MIAGYASARDIRPLPAIAPDGTETMALPLAPAPAAAILQAVAAQFGFTVAELQGHGRARAVVQARNAASFLLRARPAPGGKPRSYPEVAAALGGRDHSTIIHAVQCAIARAARDPDYAEAVETLARDAQLGAGMVALRPMLAAGPAGGAAGGPASAKVQASPQPDAAALLADLPDGTDAESKAAAQRERRVRREQVEAMLAKRVSRPVNALDDDDDDARKRLTGSAGLLAAIRRARGEAVAA